MLYTTLNKNVAASRGGGGNPPLKGHGNEADFLGFLQKLPNWFLIDPLHYLSSRSNFDFEFAEIFVIEKRLPDSPTR
jgi:hypothetical protein